MSASWRHQMFQHDLAGLSASSAVSWFPPEHLVTEKIDTIRMGARRCD
jgi:hypothetical protein